MAQPLTQGIVRSVSSKVGTQREYESVTIFRPDTNKPEIMTVIERIQKMFVEYGATLIKIDSWGMRVLAFPIRRCRKGIYLYWRFLGGSDIVAEFERLMRLSDKIIRFYTVRIDEDIDPEARPSEVTEAIIEAAAEPGPDPEELARQAAEEAARRAAEEAAAAAAAAAASAAAAAADIEEGSDPKGTDSEGGEA